MKNKQQKEDYYMKTYLKKFQEYMCETCLNKLVAIALLVLGVLSTKIEGDGTFLMFIGMVSIYLFFIRKNCIE